MVKRKSIIVYFKSENAIKELDENILNIVYVSKKAHYAVAYLDEKKVFETKKKLLNTKGIREVIESKTDMSNYNF